MPKLVGQVRHQEWKVVYARGTYGTSRVGMRVGQNGTSKMCMLVGQNGTSSVCMLVEQVEHKQETAVGGILSAKLTAEGRDITQHLKNHHFRKRRKAIADLN